MVQPGGVEPPTYRSVVCRSIQLSYGCTCPTCGGGIVEQPAMRCKPLAEEDWARLARYLRTQLEGQSDG
jgi:hypothetical protein